jgi:hypothetical protein
MLLMPCLFIIFPLSGFIKETVVISVLGRFGFHLNDFLLHGLDLFLEAVSLLPPLFDQLQFFFVQG